MTMRNRAFWFLKISWRSRRVVQNVVHEESDAHFCQTFSRPCGTRTYDESAGGRIPTFPLAVLASNCWAWAIAEEDFLHLCDPMAIGLLITWTHNSSCLPNTSSSQTVPSFWRHPLTSTRDIDTIEDRLDLLDSEGGELEMLKKRMKRLESARD